MRYMFIVTFALWVGTVALFTGDSGTIIDPRQSLAVTDEAILARFPFSRTMAQLVSQSGVPGLTELALFQRWWDSQNVAPGHGTGARHYCDDETTVHPVTGALITALNGYPYDCRADPSEGSEAARDPFADESTSADAYVPIGLFNRFDLAPFDGSHCGEYRIVYARRSGISDSGMRNLIIFEATLPNPSPRKGLDGCYPIAKFWANLTGKSASGRAGSLERLYFTGISDRDRDGSIVTFGPVVHVDHFGNDISRGGQVRTNQFVNATFGGVNIWTLREFKLIRTCSGSICSDLEFVPVTVKGNPFGGLFNPSAGWPDAPAFEVWFANHLHGLLASNVNDIRLATPDMFNSGQSHASGSNENRYLDQLGSELSHFRSDIEAKLSAVGATLSVDEVVLRAQAQSCAGCHRLNNNVSIGGGLTWPSSLGFVHVSERLTEAGPSGRRFMISDALTRVFLPRRFEILQKFLNGGKPPQKPGQRTLSGAQTH